jgi:hypothetical protein
MLAACGLACFKLGSGSEAQAAFGRTGALGTDRAGLTLPAPEEDMNEGATCSIDALLPGSRPLPLGATHSLLVPINLELVDSVGVCSFRLPTVVQAGGADEGNPLVRLAAHQYLGIDVGCIDEMLSRQQALGHQGLLDRFGTLGLMHCCARGVHMRDEVWGIVVAALTEVDDVAAPVHATATAVVCFNIFVPLSSAR